MLNKKCRMVNYASEWVYDKVLHSRIWQLAPLLYQGGVSAGRGG